MEMREISNFFNGFDLNLIKIINYLHKRAEITNLLRANEKQ